MPFSILINMNYFAVFTAGLLYFFLGMIWYSPQNYLIKSLQLNLIKEEEVTDQGFAILISVISNCSAALTVSYVINYTNSGSTIGGMWIGIILAFTIIGLSIFISTLFNERKINFYFSDAGYHLMSFIMMGLILSVWK